MALTDLTRISTSGIATGSTIDSPILRKDVNFRGSQVGVTSALFDSSDDALEFNDNVKLKLGNSGNFSLYSDGVNGILYSQNDPLYLKGEAVFIQTNNNEASGYFLKNGAVKLYFNGGDPKFETTNHGAVVTGILTASSFSGPISNPSGISTFYDLRVTNNLTVEGTTTTLDTNLIGVDRVEVGANSNTVVGVAITQSGTADIVNLFDGSSEVLTVTDGGKVGIGVTNPSEILTLADPGTGNVISLRIVDPTATSYGAHFSFYDTQNEVRIGGVSHGAEKRGVIKINREAPNDAFTITGAGRVGIGTTNTIGATGLTVYQDDAALGNTVLIEQDGTGDAVLGFALKGIAAWQFGIDNSDSDKFKISYDGSGLDSSTSVTLDRNGKVGINSSNPQEKLDVIGNVVINGNIHQSNSSTGSGSSTKTFVLSRSYTMSTSSTDVLSLGNWGNSAFDITVFRRDHVSPAGAQVMKLYLAFAGSGTNMTSATIVQETKVTRGSIHTTTYSISEDNNDATLSVTGNDNGGESQNLTFYIIAHGSTSGFINVI